LYRVVRYHDTDNTNANKKQDRKSTVLGTLNVLKDRKQGVDVPATLSTPRRLNVDKVFQKMTGNYNLSKATAPPTPSEVEDTFPASARVKICVCALTRSNPTWKTLDDSRIIHNVIASTRRTTVMEWNKFDVQILYGANADDAFWLRHADALKRQALDEYAMPVTFKFYQKHGNFLPFNDLMRDGYHTGSEYLVRINDDTEFTSHGWISMGVHTLKNFQPPNVGVVGPNCAQGNTKILTHDMVHRTHLDIFKTYYPVVFHNWYVDDWISRVYGSTRTRKIQSWTVVHHVEQQGQRYKEVMSDKQSLQREINNGDKLIRNYLAAAQNKPDETTKHSEQIIAYSLYGNDSRYIDGAIANAKLYRKIYPGWHMRVYHDDSVPQKILETLHRHDVQLHDMSKSNINAMSWRFTVSDNVARFCARDIDSRLSMREKHAVDEWIVSGKKFHVMRDHPSHSSYAVSGGMWCASDKGMRQIQHVLKGIPSGNQYMQDMDWLNAKVWPIAQQSVLQHDSFSCDKFGGGLPFPTPRVGWEHVGSVYINGQMRKGDIQILRQATSPQICLSRKTSVTVQDKDHAKLPICIGLVAHQGVKTLDATLLSYKKTGFLDMSDDFHILFQQIDSPERRAWADHVLSQYPTLLPIFQKENVGHQSFVHLADSCANSSLVFMPLEEDFVIKVDNVHVRNQITNAMRLLRDKTDAVKMRNRILPGEPNYSYESWKQGTLGSTHLLSHVMWDEDAEKHVAGIWQCGTDPKTWCANSKHAHYTNNPTMYNTEFAKKIFHMVPEHSVSTQKFEQWLTTYWSQQNFQVAHSDGIFTHERLDRELGKKTPTHTIKKNVVMAAALGYGLQDFQNFILPLRAVSDDDIVLFVADEISKETKDLCNRYGVTTRKLPTGSRLGVKGNRYIGYAEICQNYHWCFATDFRDVFFQDNPFKSIPVAYDLILSEEFHTVSISKCPYNSKWIQSCWGDSVLSEIGFNVPICSGTILGNSKGFQTLKESMLTEMQTTSKTTGCEARDQGHLNYLYYTQKIKVNILVQPRGKGIVNTIGYITPRNTISQYLNVNGNVVNDNGIISPVVHQYDRFPEVVSALKALLLKASSTNQRINFITNKQYLSLCDAGFRTRSRNDLKLPVKRDAVVCVQGTREVLDAFFKLDITTPFTLVSIESDESVPQNIKWLENKYLQRWYSWNSVDDRVTAIPIGLNHDSQLNAMMKAKAADVKIDKVLVNFKQDTKERIDLFEKVKALDFVHVEPYHKKWTNTETLKNHYETISKYKWVLCPRGAGLDTHRLWEALYLGATPVVVRSALSPLYEDLPIIQLNDWNELSLEKLQTLHKSLSDKKEKTTFSYWAHQIKEKHHNKVHINKSLFTSFFSKKMCYPGRTGENCTEQLHPANPWYVEDCPNLRLSDTLDLNASLKDLGGREGCQPPGNSMGLPLSYCAYLCYAHPLTGVTVVPFSIWKTAQVAESRAWNGNTGSNDRSDEHKQGFQGFSVLNGLYLGDIIEVGAGPWTQTRTILDIFKAENTVRSFTIHEPAADFYKQNTPSCAYKSGRLAKINGDGFYSFPVTVVGEKGESLTDRHAQYDTLVAINVIEHVQNAYEYLEGLHKTLKPQGLLIFHERFFADPVSGDKVLGRNLYHPIRITRFVLDVFLEQFDVLTMNENPTPGMLQRKANEHGYYVIARKKQSNTIMKLQTDN
tara:strand:+ start:2207 stop:7276 length:5070 start_codon:yes stop_codon:yes gene_type:complete